MTSLKIGDLVWAKMKGFPPWPGLISDPPEELKEMPGNIKKNSVYHCIYFFGTRNYGWLEVDKLKPYLEHREALKASNKSIKFRKACKEIEGFIKKKIEPSRIEAGCDKVISIPPQEEILDSTDMEPAKETKDLVEEPALEAETFSNLFPTIKLEKLKVILAPKNEPVLKKRSSQPPKRVAKKKRASKYSDADTTTPLDYGIIEATYEEITTFSQEEEVVGISGFPKLTPGVSLEIDEVPNETSTKDDIIPSHFKIGFIGLGVMGRGIVHNLLKTGHKITIWNRSSDKVIDFQNTEARVVSTPGEVVKESDIIFCCVSDATASKEIMFKVNGVLHFLNTQKAYVDLTSIDVDSSLDLSEAVYSKGSRYMEVRLQGSKKEADEGTLICLAAGEQSLYDDCSSFFKACSKKSFFMGEAGNASKMHLVIQLMTGITLAGLAESMALADRAGINQLDLLKILQLSHINCPLIMEKAYAMKDGTHTKRMALKNLQNDLRYALSLGDIHEHPTPLAATANELFKHARKLGYGDHDVSSVFLGARF